MSQLAFHVFAKADAMTQALVAAASHWLQQETPCTLLLSGGTTPRDFYMSLGDASLDWANIHLALVDERWVDADAAGSNAALVRQTLMQGRAAAARFTPMKTADASPYEAVATLDKAYRRLPPPALTILGMGSDAHTASWFAGAEEYEAVSDIQAKPLVGALTAPASPVVGDFQQRMTITGRLLAKTRQALLIVKGDRKIDLLRHCLKSDADATPIGRAGAILGSRLSVFALTGGADA